MAASILPGLFDAAPKKAATGTGMTGTEIALLISSLMGGIGGMFGGEGQELESFSREAWDGVNLDPRKLMATGIKQHSGLSSAVTELARKPIKLRSAYAQSPPTFAGGGMPMPIGLTGRDPALDDKSLLELEGLNIPEDWQRESFGGVSGNPGPQNGSPLDGAPKPPHRGPTKGQDLMSGMGDPASEAMAAIDLLMPRAK